MLTTKITRSGSHHSAADPVGQHAGEQRRDHAAEQDSRNDDGQLSGIQPGRCLEERQGTSDDSDIHPVEQPAEPGDKE